MSKSIQNLRAIRWQRDAERLIKRKASHIETMKQQPNNNKLSLRWRRTPATAAGAYVYVFALLSRFQVHTNQINVLS